MGRVRNEQAEPFCYRTGNERRGIRSLVCLYYKDRVYEFPADKESLDRIMSDIMKTVDYCFKRTSEKGYVEPQMVEELHNIALVLRGYCEVKYGDLWNSVFNDFNKKLFRYVLEQGAKYDKRLTAKLLVRSELLQALSIYIYQFQNYECDINLILNYNDISVEAKDRNMLCFMAYQVCHTLKDKYSVNMEELSVEELLTGIRTYYFYDRKEETGRRIRELLSILKEDGTSGSQYDRLVRELFLLYEDKYINIRDFEDNIRQHILYKLMYHPGDIDYRLLDLNVFVNIKSRIMVDNAIKYGGYVLYKRVRQEYKRNKDIVYSEAFRQILDHEAFRRMYNEGL